MENNEIFWFLALDPDSPHDSYRMERIIEQLYPNPKDRKDLEKIQNKYLADFADLRGEAHVKYYRKYCSSELVLEIILNTITLQIS